MHKKLILFLTFLLSVNHVYAENQKLHKVMPSVILENFFQNQKPVQPGVDANLVLILGNFGIYKDISNKILKTIPKEIVLVMPWYAPYDHDLIKQAQKNGNKILLGLDQKNKNWPYIKKVLKNNNNFIGISVETTTDSMDDYQEIIDFAKKNSFTVIFSYPCIYQTVVNNYFSVNEHIHIQEDVSEISTKMEDIAKRVKQGYQTTAYVDITPIMMDKILQWLQDIKSSKIVIGDLGFLCQKL
jgi:hypothetical protein